TQLEILEFGDTLIQHIESVKKSIDKRALHKREYDSWDTSSRSGNDAHADDADIRPIYDEEPMVEVQTTAEINVFATGQQHTEQPEFINEGKIQKKGFAIAALKNELRKLTGNSVNTKFAKPSILGKPVGQPLKNQSVVRQPTAFKSERPRISKPRFASQVDVNNDLSKPVTTHHFPKRKESAPAKPHHMIASSSSRWVPTGKTFASSTTKVESEPPNGSNADIPNQCESEQALNVSAVQASVVNDKWCLLKITLQAPFLNVQMTSVHISSGLVLHQMTSDHNRSELGIQDHSNEQSSSKLVPKVVPLAATSRQEMGLLFHLHIAMLRTTVKAVEEIKRKCMDKGS
ncbi:hypothetical protein Tco_0921768, partial [Tanacetum coccineum]